MESTQLKACFETAEGIGASVFDWIMREQAKNEGSKQAALKQQEEGYTITIKQNIKESKEMSSGLLAKYGVFALDNPSFVQGFYECLQCTKQETIINKIKTACNKHEHDMFQKFNLSKYAAYLQYKCHENDAAIPMSVGKRRKCCIKLMQCKHPHMPAMSKMMEPVLSVLTWMLSMHWWVSV